MSRKKKEIRQLHKQLILIQEQANNAIYKSDTINDMVNIKYKSGQWRDFNLTDAKQPLAKEETLIQQINTKKGGNEYNFLLF